jgi:hypothetical protein
MKSKQARFPGHKDTKSNRKLKYPVSEKSAEAL